MRRLLKHSDLVVMTMVAALALAACTSTQDRTSGPTRSSQVAAGGSPIPTRPVVAGPTSTTRKACPLVALSTVQSTVGQRLDHATVQTSGGTVIGCEFFPITSGFANENLPTGGYPSAKIAVTTYESSTSARQVLALTARAGGSPSLQHVNGLVAETFQDRFYPPDGRGDWFCAFIKGALLVTVSVAENKSQGQQIALDLAGLLVPKV